MLRTFLTVLLLLCSALHSTSEEPSLAIFTYQVYGMQPWDPDSIATGINGSEEAVIYIAQKLANIGYRVTVYGFPPEGTIYTKEGANPRYVSVYKDDGAMHDIAISWRMPDAAERLRKRAKYVYLWPHDTYDAPLTEQQIGGFDDVLWLSRWQRKYWSDFNPPFNQFNNIIGNGINPDQFSAVTARENPYSCIYASNYARGLEVLLDIWPVIKVLYPAATLDIYYGWQTWGLLTPQKEMKMRLQVASLAKSGVTDHGRVGHDELNRAFARSSFWVYPCVYPEVFCITALRAQLAGAVPVYINEAALTETVRHGYGCKQLNEFLATVLKALQQAPQIELQQRIAMGDFIRQEYTWEAVAQKWKDIFDIKMNSEVRSQNREWRMENGEWRI